MTAYPDLERRVTDLFADETPQRAPDWLLSGALATIEVTSQRRVLIRMPRRFQDMNSYPKVAIAAVVVLVVGAVGLTFLRFGQGPSERGPAVSPSTSPSTSPSPRLSPTIIQESPPPLTQAFTSSLYGLSMTVPAGWTVELADQPWTTDAPRFDSPTGDRAYDPALTDHLFIWAGSKAITGQTGAAWAAEAMSNPELCGSTPQPITVDGVDGLLCEGAVAVGTGDRGYQFALYTSGDEPWLPGVYDEAWFSAVLDTVQLAPEDAVDASP